MRVANFYDSKCTKKRLATGLCMGPQGDLTALPLTRCLDLRGPLRGKKWGAGRDKRERQGELRERIIFPATNFLIRHCVQVFCQQDNPRSYGQIFKNDDNRRIGEIRTGKGLTEFWNLYILETDIVQ